MAEPIVKAGPARSLCDLPAAGLRALIARREVSSREVVEAHLERIGRLDPALRAFTQVFSHRALADADRADRGPGGGGLHGLPVSIKENLDLEGERTTLGVTSRGAIPARRDAAMVTLLREAGA